MTAYWEGPTHVVHAIIGGPLLTEGGHDDKKQAVGCGGVDQINQMF